VSNAARTEEHLSSPRLDPVSPLALANPGAVPPAVDGARPPKPPMVRYVGFQSTAAGREYTMHVTGGGEPRDFVLLVPHEAFASRAARYQDAPDLCFRRMQRELGTDPGQPPGPGFVLTAEELLDYRTARDARPPVRKRRPPVVV